jgi:hypothetical protein
LGSVIAEHEDLGERQQFLLERLYGEMSTTLTSMTSVQMLATKVNEK